MMSPKPSPAVSLLLLLASPLGPPAFSQPAPVTPSPGQIALLLKGEMGAAELALCREALAGPRADSRAAAARVARLNGLRQLTPALLQSLAAEADVHAAREQMQALGSLAGEAATEALLSAAARFEGVLDDALATSLAQGGGPALAVAPRLAALELRPESWSSFFTWAMRGGRVDPSRAASVALDTGSAEAWAGLLASLARRDAFLPDAATARAVRAVSARTRERTFWHLLAAQDRGLPIGPETMASLAGAPESSPAPGADPPAVLAFEMLGRSLGREATDRTSLIRGLSYEDALDLPSKRSFLSRLLKPEGAALGEVRAGDKDWASDTLKGLPEREGPYPPIRDPRIRTPLEFPPGVVSDVLAVSGCQPRDVPVWAQMDAVFNPDGTLGRIAYRPPEDSDPCNLAARVLLLMSLLPVDRPPVGGGTDIVLLPLSTEYVECIAQVEPAKRAARLDAAEGRSGRRRVQEPRKTRNVPPSYPEAAKREGRQGVIILEAVIGTRGCIRSVEVFRGEHPDLAGRALRAVVQWRYTPTVIDDQPVPVIMTVTVNFKLSL